MCLKYIETHIYFKLKVSNCFIHKKFSLWFKYKSLTLKTGLIGNMSTFFYLLDIRMGNLERCLKTRFLSLRTLYHYIAIAF